MSCLSISECIHKYDSVTKFDYNNMETHYTLLLPIDVEVPTSVSSVNIVGDMAEQSLDTSEPVPENQQSQLDKCIEENNFHLEKRFR